MTRELRESASGAFTSSSPVAFSASLQHRYSGLAGGSSRRAREITCGRLADPGPAPCCLPPRPWSSNPAQGFPTRAARAQITQETGAQLEAGSSRALLTFAKDD